MPLAFTNVTLDFGEFVQKERRLHCYILPIWLRRREVAGGHVSLSLSIGAEITQR